MAISFLVPAVLAALAAATPPLADCPDDSCAAGDGAAMLQARSSLQAAMPHVHTRANMTLTPWKGEGLDFDGNDAYGPVSKICSNAEANTCITTAPGYYQYWKCAPDCCPGGNFPTSDITSFCKAHGSDCSKMAFGHLLDAGDECGTCYELKLDTGGKTVIMMGIDAATESAEIGFDAYMKLTGLKCTSYTDCPHTRSDYGFSYSKVPCS